MPDKINLHADTLYATELIVPKTSGIGIKFDPTAPAFGWRDIIGDISVRGSGANDPAFNTWIAGIRQFEFSATVMKEVFIVFHIPHDYVPGTDIHFHAHWSNAAAVPNTGNVIWGFEIAWAQGFNQQAFGTLTRTAGSTSTVTVTQACPATRYQHNIAETTAQTLTGLEVDSLVICRVYRDATAGGDTCTDAVFLHTADIHYQTTNVATKNKAPSFYA